MDVNMQTVSLEVKSHGQYMGFNLYECRDGCWAVPRRKWPGHEVLQAENLQDLVTLVRHWWYRVEMFVK